MNAIHEEPITLDLTEDDLKALPKAFREKIKDGNGQKERAGHWLILSARSTADARLTKRIIGLVAGMAAERRRKVTDDQILKLVDVFLEGEDRSDVDLDLQRDNARIRADYIKQAPCYSATEIRSFQVGDLPKNPSDPAARWKREKRLFAIPYGNTDLFPAFQFEDGLPHPGVKRVLNALPEGLTPWQIAFWFASGNSWLGGKTPQSVLGSIGDVVEAAEQLSEPAVG